jgi:hypothetical protein
MESSGAKHVEFCMETNHRDDYKHCVKNCSKVNSYKPTESAKFAAMPLITKKSVG